ncbi:sulfotransferase [Winogradskyella sp. 3972H.M.0a.05]|uniref:sulfotransferase n=1 Tax=Winogradskyella sp. 3972H.M.0a.05 TaxID=2950277 RepID=UPI00339A950D
MKRLIILASERSGTNLLRVLLGNHSQLSAPVAVHFFNTFKPNINLYGDLNKEDNATRLIEHFLRSANHEYTNWEFQIGPKTVVRDYNVNSLETAFDAIHKSYAKAEGKPHYVSKDNDLYYFVNDIQLLDNEKDETYFIYLYRDPRDQAVSWLKTPLFLHTAFDIAMKWRTEQAKVRSLQKEIDMFSLSYEELIENTKKTMTELLAYVGLEAEEACFSTNKDNKESKTNALWKNLSQPIIKSNSKKYREKLDKGQIKIIESLCKDDMTRLGYELDTSGIWKYKLSLYRRYILPYKRKKAKDANSKFMNDNMASLTSKLELLNALKEEAKNAKSA